MVKKKLKKDGTKSLQGEGGGRPPKYSSAEEVWNKANDFFKSCDEARQLPEKAGICLHLGINRDTYNEYRKRFPDAIKGIDLYIESCWARRLNGQAATGAIFYLKNAFRDHYQDRQETDITSGGESLKTFSNEQLSIIARRVLASEGKGEKRSD